MLRKQNRLHIALELVTIFSFIVIGVTILTFMYYDVEMSKSYLGSLVLAIGVTELVSFLSLRDLAKLRNIPNAVTALLQMILGVILMVIDVELPIVCIVWGICNIVFLVTKVVDAGLNLIHQPFLNIIIIILCIIETIFSIFLIAKSSDIQVLNHHIVFIGIALLVRAFILVIEFVIHRYQKL